MQSKLSQALREKEEREQWEMLMAKAPAQSCTITNPERIRNEDDACMFSVVCACVGSVINSLHLSAHDVYLYYRFQMLCLAKISALRQSKTYREKRGSQLRVCLDRLCEEVDANIFRVRGKISKGFIVCIAFNIQTLIKVPPVGINEQTNTYKCFI